MRAINKSYELIGENDFEFLVASRRTLTTPVSSCEYNYNAIKLLCGQGSIYIRMREEMEFLLEPRNVSDEESDLKQSINDNYQDKSTDTPKDDINPVLSDVEEVNTKDTGVPDQDALNSSIDSSMSEVLETISGYCVSKEVNNPVEILRVAQKCIVRGRSLEIEMLDAENVGLTNFINVNRNAVFETAKEEISDLLNEGGDMRLTLEVSFYGEIAKDLGGPRKEFFRLCLKEIHQKYFDHGLRIEFAQDYKIIGVIISLSMLQNGPIPDFIPQDVISQIISTTDGTDCIRNLCDGLNTLGIVDLCRKFPILRHLFQPNPKSALSRKGLLRLLEPQFSIEGCNRRKREEEVYTIFNKYLRETAAGRFNNVTLENILQFVTCCDKEPILGFTLKPTISFSEVENDSKWLFTPSAHTCSHVLDLPIRRSEGRLPIEADLFEVYNTAFLNAFFGKV